MNFTPEKALFFAVLRLLALVALLHPQTPPPSFSLTALSAFDGWDVDRDGTLASGEIDRAALDPHNHGREAAALAALHVWLKVAGDDAPKLTKAWFEAYRPGPLPVMPKGATGDEAKAAKRTRAASPNGLQSGFLTDLKRIETAPKTLFVGEGPSFEGIQQGALGNCFMLAPLGALVHRSPDDVRSMIRAEGDGYAVAFPDGKTVHIAAPTDAAIGMGGASMKSGLWVRVVEKAFGSRSIPEGEFRQDVPHDRITGGSTTRAALDYTGHHFEGPSLVGDYRKDVPDAKLDPILEAIRRDVPHALTERRLVLAATTGRGVPRSITPNHGYAVFGFDPSADRITLWNPHRDDFTPKGDEGFEGGYRRQGGVFSMPLKEFGRSFVKIMIEQPADSNAPETP